MLIGIDGNEANVERKVGIGEYAYELLMQFYKSQISNLKSQKTDVKYNIYLKNVPGNDLPKENDNWQYTIVGPKKLWTQIGLPLHLLLEKEKPDVFFTPSHYAPRFSPVPTAIAIMDVSYLHYPEFFAKKDLYQLRSWTKYSAKYASLIFTISESSKNDIINHYHVPSERVIVIYPGIKEVSNSKYKVSSMDELKKNYGISDHYILFVGTLQPRKNIVRLIEAYAKVRIKDLQLVIVGKKGWLFEEILAAPEKFQCADKVKFLDFVSDDDLPSLYKHALCFVLPSLYEGFGLPVLEAMKYGCPVITSNVSSLPEAGGDAALYVDPENVDDIADKIQKVISDKKLRETMMKKGYEQIKKFSWEKAAKQTLTVLKEVAEKKYA